MNQKRIDIFTRKISEEEAGHREKMKEIGRQIQNLKSEQAEKRKNLKNKQDRQKKSGLMECEIQITDKVILEKLSVYRTQIKLLEKDYQKLVAQQGMIQEQSSKQADMFEH